MKARVTFSLYFDYEVEGETERECFDKAEEMFDKDCRYSYDEWDIEVEDEDDE